MVVLYKFPACSLEHFKQESLAHLKHVVDTEKNLIVLGDFNFDLLSGHASLLDFMKLNFNCRQIVQKATHDSGSQLDLILPIFLIVKLMSLKHIGQTIKLCTVVLDHL